MKFNKVQAELKLNSNVPLRQESIGNTDYTVVPVIMMTVGVHAGSGGALYYSQEQLNEFHQAWNGVPVSIQHPDIDGQPVSCNHPEFYESQVVGTIFNTVFDNGKLKAEAWLETSKSAQILSYINSGNNLQVSTGLFSNDVGPGGEWQGEQYNAMATNIRPDHLALLPGGEGACNWADGCGIRANEEGGEKALKRTKTNKKEEQKESILIHETQDIEWPELKANNIDYSQLLDMVHSKVDAMDNDERVFYARRVFNDHVIYRANLRGSVGSEAKLYKRNYNVTNGKVEWTSDPVEVMERVSYDVVPSTNEIKNNKGETEMADETKVCCPEEVTEFIGNEGNAYTEADKDWILALPEVAFKSLVANTPEKKEEKAPVVNTESTLLSQEQLDSIAYGEKVMRERKNVLIGNIKANTNNQFSDADLGNFDMDMLEKLSKQSPAPTTTTNYSGIPGEVAPEITDNEEEPMEDIYNKTEKE